MESLSDAVVAFHSVSKVYGHGAGEVRALDDVTVVVPRGGFTAVMGPSGSGKSTFMNVAAGLDDVTAGEVYVAGQPLHRMGDRDRTLLRRVQVGFVFQSYNLVPTLDVLENVLLPFELAGRRLSAEERAWVDHLVDVLGLANRVDHRPGELSGGQQQRVALARALVNGPQVLLLDEPLGALDLKLRKQLQLELKALQHDLGITFVHVTHDQEEAMTMADTIAVMNRGQVEQLGEPAELYDRPRTEFVAGFLGVSNLLRGTVTGPDRVRIETGDELTVPLAGRTGDVAIGVRPEKFRLGPPLEGENALSGTVKETAYVGVATQYIITTGAGDVVVYAQNRDGDRPLPLGSVALLSWSPESTFVLDPQQKETAA
jgi:spermidine/putrescine transport system ATP-binding protein